jgi:hypothetical protein
MVKKVVLLILLSLLNSCSSFIKSNIKNSIGNINVYSNGYNSHGTGLFINYSDKIYFLTNAHVCLWEYKTEIYKTYKNDYKKLYEI